jgi:protein O-mannosyl-transferase
MKKVANLAKPSNPKNKVKSDIFKIISSGYYPYLILIIIPFVLYFQSLSFDYSYLDDDLIIKNNLNKLQNPSTLIEAFKTDPFFNSSGQEFYRPLQTISFVFDTMIGSKSLWMFHLTNIILHISTVLLLFILLINLEFDRKISLLFSLIFAVNPLLTHAVVWLPSRGDLLIGVFCLLSFISFIRYINTHKVTFLIIHLFSFLFAVFSKETALLLPILMGIYLFYIKNNNGKSSLFSTTNIILLIFWTLIISSYLILRSFVIVSLPNSEIFGIVPFFNNFLTLPELFGKFFVPLNLSLMPQFSIFSSLIGFIILLAYFTLLIKYQSLNKFTFFGIFWFVIFLITSLIYRHQLADYSYNYLEQRSYLPSIGLIILLISIANTLNPDTFRTNLKFIWIPGIILFFTLTFIHSQNYKNPETFFGTVIAQNPNNAIAHYNLGNYLLNIKNNPQLAIQHYDKTSALKSDFPEAYLNRGSAYSKLSNFQSAMNDYNEAIREKPDFDLAYNSRGILYVNLKMDSAAIADFNRVIEINPDNATAFNNLANLLQTEGKYYESIEYYTRAINLNNYYADAYCNRGTAKFYLKDTINACDDWKEAASLNHQGAKQWLGQFCK